ncbi:MAG: xanthine dehydrogenase family protein molybdopterin-binding subunit [Pseudomonadota bacterium]
MTENGIGAAARRKEDQRFLTGNGNYLDDLKLEGQTYAYFVRSPHAHASFTIDTSRASSAPGVVGILTGADAAADGLGGLICGWNVVGKNGEGHIAPPHPALAVDAVRHVGDALAVVIAESYEQAKDAAEQLDVEYDVLPSITVLADALHAGAHQVHEEAPGNICYDWEIGDQASTDAAFANAHHITKLDLVNNRIIPNAIEPRACNAKFDPGTDEFTLYLTSQNPHVHRLVLSAFIGIAPEHKLHVIAPDVGGGFGSKIFIYQEETIVTWASKKVGRPVKWTAERSESFVSDAHGRDHLTHAELAMDEKGKFLGLRVSTVANMGAYLSTFASSVPSYLYGTLLQGQYTTGAIYCEVKAVFTNTTPVDAVRGAGRPEATYVIERIVEEAARDMNIDPAELRRRNFIPTDAFPYETQVALAYDIGDYGASLEKALQTADYAGIAQRKASSKSNGKLRGLGFASYIEACGIAPSQAVGQLGAGVGLWESANVRFNPTGQVIVNTGSHSHGQGHETTFAQVVADRLGVPFENVDVIHGDTQKTPFGMGTYGSRSLAVGGSAICKAADKLIEKGKKIAAHIMEASEQDIEFADGNFTVAGTDKAMNIGEVAFAAYVPHNYPLDVLEPGFDESAYYDPANFTFPAGTHICEVEIDPDTGTTELVNWVAVDDFGEIINPMIVEGQVHGGVAQGVGQAMLEGAAFDGSGQLVTGSFMDYCMPRADNMPDIKVDYTITACPHNPLGVKGCGEAGAIAAPAALMNAITDAIGKRVDMPATPQNVWKALQG